MSILARAAKPAREPFIGTIVGVQGTGKSTIAATFPDVLIIRTQGERPPEDVPDQPMTIEVDTASDLWAVLKELVKEDHPYKSVAFDTVSGLDTMFTAEVLASDPNSRGLNQAHGGYGNGAAMVTAMHMRVRRACEVLRKRGINVLFLAHAEIADINPPDGDPYSTYTLRLPKKSMATYLDSVDLVGFLKQHRVVKGATEAKSDRAAKPGRAISSGDRVLVTYLDPANVSKNRFGIEEDIDVEKGVNPLAAWVVGAPAQKPARNAKAAASAATAAATNESEEENV